MMLENPNRLTDDRLNRLLPALSLLAEDIGDRVSMSAGSLDEILASVGEDHGEWPIVELELWRKTLENVRDTPDDNHKNAAIAALRNRGIPEFPAMLAVYVTTNQQDSPAAQTHPIPSSASGRAGPVDKPAEVYHNLLPDHGWHNDLTWEQLPDWVKGNPELIARLKRGEQVIGKNVRYRFVANKLIRRLRYRIQVASGAGHPTPAFIAATSHFKMIDNTRLLGDLMAKGLIRLQDSQILRQIPLPLPASFAYDKVEGMLLGIAIGDALGATSEGLSPSYRRGHYGEIREYVSDRRPRHHRPAGQVTDDTQMSFWTVEQLIDDHGLRPESLARKFCEHRIWGIGGTVRKFISNFKDQHVPWYLAGSESLGNGALMRIAPILIPYVRNPHPSMYADAALATMITHNDFANNACSVAFVKMLWELLRMRFPPEPEWWIDTFCSTARELEGDTAYDKANGVFSEYAGPLWHFTSVVCKEALRKKLTVEEACSEWMSGANLFETVPSVLYILSVHAQNPEEAIIRAVNDTEDNDSIASIVGAAVGALHGLSGIPDRWVKNLNGRIQDRGGPQVFNLIAHSKQEFWLRS
jgi:ADP-ribosyl-[dinitrogen reductase] hydrolase